MNQHFAKMQLDKEILRLCAAAVLPSGIME